ncbi:DMT family transporter [Streptomyces tremellae]|uniref:Integral membrane protein n=1 Tax=Streptomyces tremellae TaxID=1124239 RepID=A0ABP7GBG0_9ACTN
MSSLALAVALSAVSAVAYAAGAVVQERVAAASPAMPYGPLRSGPWWGSVALNGAGGLLHVGALAYGPLSLVQPLGALTVVFALPMAALWARGRAAGAGQRAWAGAVTATAGLAGLLALTRGSGGRVLEGPVRLLLALVALGLVGAACVAAALVRGRAARSVLLAAAGGVAFGVSSVFVKTVTQGWSAVPPWVQWPSLGAVAVLTVAGLLLSQAAYRGAGLAAPLAVVTVVNPVVAAAVGLTLFGEGFRFGAAGGAGALALGAVAARGLVVLTRARPAAGPGGPAATGPARASGPSDPDAVRPQVGERVDVAAVGGARAHLEVEVGSRHVAGRP